MYIKFQHNKTKYKSDRAEKEHTEFIVIRGIRNIKPTNAKKHGKINSLHFSTQKLETNHYHQTNIDITYSSYRYTCRLRYKQVEIE